MKVLSGNYRLINRVNKVGRTRNNVHPDIEIRRVKRGYKKKIEGFTPGALQRLKSYSWKGNVRELQNVVARAAILCEEERVGEGLLALGSGKNDVFVEGALHSEMTEEDLVKWYAQEVFKRCKGNKKETARILGINFRTLVSRLHSA